MQVSMCGAEDNADSWSLTETTMGVIVPLLIECVLLDSLCFQEGARECQQAAQSHTHQE